MKLEKAVLKRFGEKSKQVKEFYKILERSNEKLERVDIVAEWNAAGNVKARISVMTGDSCEFFETRCSTWGVDQLSVAIAKAFNKSYLLLCNLYKKENERLGKRQKVSRRDYLGKAADSGDTLPHFIGGMGANNLIEVLQKFGLKKVSRTGSQNVDVYILER